MFGNKWEPGVLESTHPLRDATTSYTTYRKAYDAKIHASLARCDPLIDTFTLSCFMLKSTHPLRDATGDGYYLVHIKGAKIHASLARCDRKI